MCLLSTAADHLQCALFQFKLGTDFLDLRCLLSLMSEDTETLAELMFHAAQFCSKVEEAMKDVAPIPEEKDLRTKLGQCRNQLVYLQELFNDGKLNIENPRVRADFRQLVMALLWIAFYARSAIDFRIFRMVVRIESGFTYLLVNR